MTPGTSNLKPVHHGHCVQSSHTWRLYWILYNITYCPRTRTNISSPFHPSLKMMLSVGYSTIIAAAKKVNFVTKVIKESILTEFFHWKVMKRNSKHLCNGKQPIMVHCLYNNKRFSLQLANSIKQVEEFARNTSCCKPWHKVATKKGPIFMTEIPLRTLWNQLGSADIYF